MNKQIVTRDNLGTGFEFDTHNNKINVAAAGGNATTFVNVTDLQTQPVGVGFIAFEGIETKTAPIPGLPARVNTSDSTSDPKLGNVSLSNNYRFSGYQIDTGTGSVFQILHWGNNEWYRRGSGTQPSVNWGKWVRHGYDNDFISVIDQYM